MNSVNSLNSLKSLLVFEWNIHGYSNKILTVCIFVWIFQLTMKMILLNICEYCTSISIFNSQYQFIFRASLSPLSAYYRISLDIWLNYLQRSHWIQCIYWNCKWKKEKLDYKFDLRKCIKSPLNNSRSKSSKNTKILPPGGASKLKLQFWEVIPWGYPLVAMYCVVLVTDKLMSHPVTST